MKRATCLGSLVLLSLACENSDPKNPQSSSEIYLNGPWRKFAPAPTEVARCGSEEREIALKDTLEYLGTNETDVGRAPIVACCGEVGGRAPGWRFMTPPRPSGAHHCRVVSWNREGWVGFEHKDAFCSRLESVAGCMRL